ncbi:hypothetical protein QJS04_geneDACA019606 [Acorus gramineus]|uniref:Phosphatidylinositol-glycan biosynthesis class F protein n=1 Tax=Acorus gramineus TaxID=55184 RepID=A0AAV8ZXL8_ACOGR|nr:hypothetical protein QJS04_geneDACA019606 [Acorus gramineus]
MGETDISVWKASATHIICGLGLFVAFRIARDVHGSNLVSDTVQTLRLLLVVEAPLIIGIYGFFRRDPQHCSWMNCMGFGVSGALVNAFGAVVLGAPIRIQYLTRTLYWSLLMSLFTILFCGSCISTCFAMWLIVFFVERPRGVLEYMICLPAHGAVIGAWFGAWPMPLDWERPWQEWPICVTYGAVVGYSLGMLASLVCTFVQNRRQHVKGD